jgi:transcriptional regulator with XRE-family HTH domain
LTNQIFSSKIFADERSSVLAVLLKSTPALLHIILKEEFLKMAGEFGAFIDAKRRGRTPDGKDILLKDIAEAMGMTATYLSDIIKGRRNPPKMELLEKIAAVLYLTDEEKAIMFDLAGRECNEVSPDLPEYIMNEDIPHARTALRRAKDKGLSDDFWKKVNDSIDEEK